MPRQTERQATTEVLFEAFVLQLLVEGQQNIQVSSYESSVSESSDEEEDTPLQPLSTSILVAVLEVNSRRYLQDCITIPKTSENLYMLLGEYKMNYPNLFRSYMRMSPMAFDSLVEKLRDHPVFHNRSENEQLPVEVQVAVLLYRFAHFGNAASVQKVGLWAGLGYGTVNLITRRVLTAICHEPFRRRVMKWPGVSEKEAAKVWVEE
ncbi:hypothetical protein M422DRAFT_262317 [Sphaerobolus stellatus SS14]|uniref:Unplaced genomic scaffold SPHSTscaffold_114, whole genome shotgun sequence n=1 Tax=Sphaerobolus stellatus (strain SS14) TaxID=990650 RepID=A0A0C9VD90_SPHS4|nr:hypothetical protein M422DRAFT_262317 [Sphaerobolus stellatus SS14]